MPERWFFGLDAWIVQDGNYPDFQVGQTCLFAVEFFPEDDLRVASGHQRADRIEGDRYSVTATVIANADAVKCCVIDLGGLMAYRARAGVREQFLEGETIQGQMELGVDPFDYFETLGYRNDIPPLMYQWTVVRIFRQAAPWVEVEATDAWHDEVKITGFGGGRPSYLLACCRDAREPVRPPRPLPVSK